eukprot:jgi/Bigna1/144339/aug1.86_g19047
MVSTHGYFYNHRHHHPDWRDDSWAYSLTEGWFQRIQLTSTDNPKAAFYPTSIAYKGDVFMFGGDHMQGNGNQGHTFGTSFFVAPLYPEQALDLHYSNRFGHTIVGYDNKIWLYGGNQWGENNGPCSCREDTWQYDLKRNKWRQLSTGNNPTSRYSHSMVFWNDALYVFGGESMVPYMYHNEIKSLPLAKWTQDEL